MLQHVERAVAAAPSGVDRFVAEGELDAFRGIFSVNRGERTRYLEQAVASFETVLQVQPDHFWALGCFFDLSTSLGRPPSAARLEHYVALRPNSVAVFRAAAEHALKARDFDAAREYARRGRALDVPIDARSAHAVSWVLMFPIHDALRQNDPRRALLEADRVAADPRSRSPEMAYGIGFNLFLVYLQLGRLDRAEQIAAWGDMGASRNRFLAILARERGDRDALRRLLQRTFPQLDEVVGGSSNLASQVFLAFIDAGMLDSARELLQIIKERVAADWRSPGTRLGASFSAAAEAHFSVAEGHAVRGVQLLEQFIRDNPGGRGMLRASLTLADEWVRREKRARAIGVLEHASRSITLEGCPLDCMRLRERLAQLYRHDGRLAEAEGIEAELLHLLSAAEDDFPMKQRLTRHH